MGSKRINLKVSEEVYAWIKYMAKSKGISMTELINRFIDQKIEEEKANAPQQY